MRIVEQTRRLKREALAERWHFHLGICQEPAERRHRLLLAMDEEGDVRAARARMPVEELGLIGMCREAVDRVHLGSDCNLLAEKPDLGRTVYDLPGESPFRCEADEYDARLAAPEILLQVMPDPPSRAPRRARRSALFAFRRRLYSAAKKNAIDFGKIGKPPRPVDQTGRIA